MILHPVLGVVFLAKESWRLGVIVVGRPLDVEILGEVGARFGAEIDSWGQIGEEFRRIRFQFRSIRLRVRRRIADSVFVLDTYTELVIPERFQVADVADAATDPCTSGEPIAIRKFAHLYLIRDRDTGTYGDGWFPGEREMAIHHSADDRTVGQRQRNPGFTIFVEVRVLVSKRFLRAWFQCLNGTKGIIKIVDVTILKKIFKYFLTFVN